MNVPDMSLISALLGQDMQNRGQAYSPGAPQDAMQRMQDNPAGALPSIGTSDLLATSQEARQGGNMDVVRALRSIIEGRTSDDFARGPGPRQSEAQGKTSAEKIQMGSPEGWGVLGKLNAALFGANNAGN